MLVLSRMKDESLVITNGAVKIRVMLVRIQQGAARIGIEAPSDWLILRDELTPASPVPPDEELTSDEPTL